MDNKTDIQNNISIVIPSRTIDFLLEKCVTEIRKLYNSVEIILIIDEYDENNGLSYKENIHIYKSINKNMSAKRNLGVKNSDKKYIAFIDSDAYPKENWLEAGIDFLENNENYCAVTGRQYNTPDDNFEQRCLRLVRFNRLFTHSEWCKIIDKNATEQDCSEFMTSNVIMRKSDYIKTEGMNEKIYIAEDNEYSERLAKLGYKIRFIPEISVYHRERNFYPFMRNIFCMSYYYANMFVKGENVKTPKQAILQFFPLLGIIFFILIWILLLYLNINPYILLILPFFVFLIITKEAIYMAKKLEGNKIKGFFFILFSCCTFCIVFVLGTLLGAINFPTKEISNLYKHY